jgi:site-specific DNA-cytosine methylase
MEKNKMVVLSCFDGMSCGQIALERAGIKVDKYYASEIDKHAIKVTQANYPNTIQLGSITEWKNWNIEKPDLIIGGSPCQGFSSAGKQLNFNDERSKLFFDFAEIIKHYKPKYFLLENVKMKKECQDVISGILGVEPIEINSALVSAQNRKRLYWTNIPNIKQPKDKGIYLKDIIEDATADRGKSYCLDANYYKGCSKEYSDKKGRRQLVLKDIGQRIIGVQNDLKHSTASEHVYHKNTDKGLLISAHVPKFVTGTCGIEFTWRKLTPIECERLQTVSENYTAHVSNTQRYKMLGNGWTVDVIAHIFRGMY